MRRKTLIFLIIISFSFNSWANDTLLVNSEIKKVVVFLKGAQVKRTTKCTLKKGENIINFTKITSHADEKSVQIKSAESVVIQSVNFTINYMDSLDRMNKINALNIEQEILGDEKQLLENKLYVLKQEQELLKENRVLGGEKRTINTEELESAANYYREQLSEIILLRKKARDKIKDIELRKQTINNQLSELNLKKEKPVGEIWVIAYAKEPGEINFSIEYFIENAGWKPKYDIRSESVSKPAVLSYKADVFQNTDDDWSNVELVLSSSNPSLGGTKPELKSWVIDMNKQYVDIQDNSNYDNSVKYYKNLKNDYSNPIVIDSEMTITGTVVDGNDGTGVPGASVIMKGKAIGTVTDLNGNYTLTIPEGTQTIIFQFMGMETTELPITGNTVNCRLENSDIALDEVVVTALGVTRQKKALGYSVTTLVNDGNGNFVNSLQGSVAGVHIRGIGSTRSKLFRKRKRPVSKTLVGLNSVKENQTSVQFVLDKPYTIPSDNKSYSVDIEKYEIPVHYQYSTVPKMEESAFLLAELTGWESLNLLSGAVNIYFEGSFIGNSQLDVNNTNDTLDISLGRDKAILIDRKLKEDFTKNQLLSKWKVEEYTWEITVKNSKADSVNVLVEDQIPISYTKNQEVELLESSDAKYDKNKGELSWNLQLKPLEKKKLVLSYRVKTKRT